MYAWLVGKAVRFLYRQVVTGRARLATALATDDVEFIFPGENSFAGRYRGKPELRAWIRRFSSLHPQFDIHDVVVSGPPWNMRVALRFTDSIGDDYRNEGMEYVRLRWGRLTDVQVFLNTETIHAWEQRHPEIAARAS
ncbi:MAG TPA: nuclear transport factor 2 family protein [Mycobacteriales bacterium]|nr:nuclear transport factor 2 family protein [Mycobacteriales bacterium]